TRGIVVRPTMPLNQAQLSDADYEILRKWIEDGARNRDGEARFPPDPNRRKWYVVNQACDMVAVFDAESRQIMRYIDVGHNPAGLELPHMVRISPDGQFWYLVFFGQIPYMEKYSTLTDELLDRITLPPGDWNTMAITPDGKFAVSVAYASEKVAVVDLEAGVMTEDGDFGWPVHGSAMHPVSGRFYVTLQDHNGLVSAEIDANGRIQNPENHALDPNVAIFESDFLPHEVTFRPDGAFTYATCQGTNEVRILDENDEFVKAISVGGNPSEFAISAPRNLLFVSCMDDETFFGSQGRKRGAIAVIDMTTNALVKHVYSGFQPHGMAVDEASGVLVVGNRNANADGPAPHHTSDCGGRNGYVTLLDLDTQELVSGFKTEVLADPYSVAVKQ
ncbi:MAG: hypothetical protein AAF570_11215, partial [Bacteroidota bacterium]